MRFLSFFLFFVLSFCSKEVIILKSIDFVEKNKKETANRGAIVKLVSCDEKNCLIEYKSMKTKVEKKFLHFSNKLDIVTVVSDTEAYKESSIYSPLVSKIDKGIRGILILEERLWAFVDFYNVRGWVLKEDLYKDDKIIYPNISLDNMILEFKGEWYIPFISGERLYSIDKAFDNDISTYSIVRTDRPITIYIKDFSLVSNYYISYSYIKTNKINMEGPSFINILYPEKTIINSGGSFVFNSNIIIINIESKNPWVYLNNVYIKRVVNDK